MYFPRESRMLLYEPIRAYKIDVKERNRDHARKTRLRKRLAFDASRIRIEGLQMEARRLLNEIEEKNTANILVDIGKDKNAVAVKSSRPANEYFVTDGGHKLPFMNIDADKILGQLRVVIRIEVASRKRQEQLQKRRNLSANVYHAKSENSKEKSKIPDKLMSNASSSADSTDSKVDPVADESDIDSDNDENFSQEDGSDSSSTVNTAGLKLTSNGTTEEYKRPADAKTTDEQRRERNKIHARLTRNRKKIFTKKVAELIYCMENYVNRLRQQLNPSAELIVHEPIEFTAMIQASSCRSSDIPVSSLKPVRSANFIAANTHPTASMHDFYSRNSCSSSTMSGYYPFMPAGCPTDISFVPVSYPFGYSGSFHPSLGSGIAAYGGASGVPLNTIPYSLNHPVPQSMMMPHFSYPMMTATGSPMYFGPLLHFPGSMPLHPTDTIPDDRNGLPFHDRVFDPVFFYGGDLPLPPMPIDPSWLTGPTITTTEPTSTTTSSNAAIVEVIDSSSTLPSNQLAPTTTN